MAYLISLFLPSLIVTVLGAIPLAFFMKFMVGMMAMVRPIDFKTAYLHALSILVFTFFISFILGIFLGDMAAFGDAILLAIITLASLVFTAVFFSLQIKSISGKGIGIGRGFPLALIVVAVVLMIVLLTYFVGAVSSSIN